MAVVSVNEHFEQGGTDDANQVRRMRRSFLVEVNDPTDDSTVVLAHADIPQRGEQHPNDSGASVAFREAIPFRPGESQHFWMVFVEYSSAAGLGIGVGDDWEWSTGYLQKVARRGYFYSNGGWSQTKIPYLTSALGRFENPPDYDEPFRILRVTRGITTLGYYSMQPSIALVLGGADGQGTVNSQEFIYHGFTWLPGEVRCVEHSARSFTAPDGGPEFVAATFVFHLRIGGWFDDMLDEDICRLVTVRIIDSQQVVGREPITLTTAGDPITEPWPLNGQGQPLRLEAGTAFGNIPYSYLRYRKFDSVPYSMIGF